VRQQRILAIAALRRCSLPRPARHRARRPKQRRRQPRRCRAAPRPGPSSQLAERLLTDVIDMLAKELKINTS
jgi:hypothetical protein